MAAKIILCAFVFLFLNQVCFVQPTENQRSKSVDYQREVLSLDRFSDKCTDKIVAVPKSIIKAITNRVYVVQAVYQIILTVMQFSYKQVALPIALLVSSFTERVFNIVLSCTGITDIGDCADNIKLVVDGIQDLIKIPFKIAQDVGSIIKIVVKDSYELIARPIYQDVITCVSAGFDALATCFGIKDLGYAKPLFLSN